MFPISRLKLTLCVASLCFCAPSAGLRIVSLAPIATEFLFELGLGSEVVGVTTYCDKPEKAKSIKKIGGFADPQLEAIVSLKPDLVVGVSFGGTVLAAESLKTRRIKTLAEPVESLTQMRHFLSSLGKATGRKKEAVELQRRLDDTFASFKGKVKGQPRVLILISSSPLIAAGPQTFPGEVLSHIGALNAVKTQSPAWPVLSLEELLKNPPDVIALSNGVSSLEAAKAHLKPLLSRHKNVKLFVPKTTILQRPGPYLNEDINVLLAGLSHV